ncbi:MAG: rRNA maturation RNase YbeY [Flavobacteriaceae bacterium]|nr:rRNA maturation RNase YbeY [Psychroflexus sp.]
MINFYSENNFSFKESEKHQEWIREVIASEEFTCDEIIYIFCDDAYLLKINQQFLNHDTYTDIITFDNSLGKTISAEIYISTERVAENAIEFENKYEEELRRVMIHGVLHCMHIKDATEDDKRKMRQKEDEKLQMFHVEQN